MATDLRFAGAAALVTLVSACAAPAHPVRPEELQPEPSHDELLAGCTGGRDNEVALDAGPGPDAPVVYLNDRLVAIWADGRIVFETGSDTPVRREGTVAKSVVDAIVAEVAVDVAALPRRSNTPTDADDVGLGTAIAVRAGGHWRAALVDEANDDYIRLVAAQPPGTPPDPILPAPFVRAYMRLRAALPANAAPFVADDMDVQLFAARGDAAAPTLAWPADLPAVPRDFAPDEWVLGRDFAIDGAHLGAGLRFERAVAAYAAPATVVAGTRRLTVQFDEQFRGERALRALAGCADRLAAGR